LNLLKKSQCLGWRDAREKEKCFRKIAHPASTLFILKVADSSGFNPCECHLVEMLFGRILSLSLCHSHRFLKFFVSWISRTLLMFRFVFSISHSQSLCSHAIEPQHVKPSSRSRQLNPPWQFPDITEFTHIVAIDVVSRSQSKDHFPRL
jgi:hypothetical protein